MFTHTMKPETIERRRLERIEHESEQNARLGERLKAQAEKQPNSVFPELYASWLAKQSI